ncbi:MAG: molybdopterin-dependent oxidoreductase [Acidobacteria bacterium]|nr:molybdopterin-dependent oxidoreductase [Acidobacteriota bacterium]
MPTDWETALKTALSGLRTAAGLGGLISGRNTNEEAFLFVKLMKMFSPQPALEVFYQERELTEVAKILMSPDRSPNFRGAREVGVTSNGGLNSWVQRLVQRQFQSAYVVGEDLLSLLPDGEKIKSALEQLSFLVVQETHLTPTARLAHVVLPATNFAEKEGTYTNRKGRVQRLHAALVPPPGPLQDWEIFTRLLAIAGEKSAYQSPGQIFLQIAAEFPRYKGLTYEQMGSQGVQPEQ